MVASNQVAKTQTRVSINQARAMKVDSGKSETEDQRVKRLVDIAIKASHESFASIADGAAAATWFAIQHGRCNYMNLLFNGMNPKDSLAFRAYYVQNIIDTFGVGGVPEVKDGVETGKWSVRPTPFFQFQQNPKTDGVATHDHFRIAKSDKPDVALRIKEGLANARSKTEGEFRLVEWVSPSQARADSVFTPVKALNGLKNAFKSIAKNLPRSGMTRVDLLRMVNVSPLDVIARTEIETLAAASAPMTNDKPNEQQSAAEGEKTDIPADHPSQTMKTDSDNLNPVGDNA